MTPLHIATEEGHVEIAKLLVEHGANVDLPCKGKKI
jgi:ankyrin repeat protein